MASRTTLVLPIVAGFAAVSAIASCTSSKAR